MWPLLEGLLTKLPGLLGPVVQLLTGINFTSMGKILSDIASNFKKYWRFYVPMLLVVCNLATLWGWHGSNLALDKEKAVHQLDISNFKAAQALADKQAQLEKQSLQKESEANATKADANYSTLLAKYRTVLMRYQANQSGASQSSGGDVQTPGGGNGPSAGTQVPSISISLDDANICAVNTARLQAVHDWATEASNAK